MVFKGDPKGGLPEITVDFNVNEGEVLLEISGAEPEGKGFTAFTAKKPVDDGSQYDPRYVLIFKAMRSADVINISQIGQG